MLEWYRKEFGFEAKYQADQCGGVDWDILMAAAAAPLWARMASCSCPTSRAAAARQSIHAPWVASWD